MDQYGAVLFTDTKPVSVTPDSKDQTKLKASVTNSDVSDLQRKDLTTEQKKELTINSFSDVLKKDTTIFLAFALLLPPLFFAFVYSLATHKQLNEQDMKKIFYVECYYFSPLSAAIWAFYYSLFFLTGGAFQLTVSIWNFVPPLLALIWFVSVETNALADESEEDSLTRLNAFFIVVACVIAIAIVGLVVSVSIADAGVRDFVRKLIIWIYLLISFGLIGIYLINWRKARAQVVTEKKTVAKDQPTKISPRLKWIGWSSLSIILCCIAGFVFLALQSVPATGTSSDSTPTASPTASNDTLKQDHSNWKLSVIDGGQDEAKSDYENNGFVRITLQPKPGEQPSANYIFTAEKYPNVQIETTATSNNDNSHTVSLICRYNETEGWYEFEVSGSGDYFIYQVNVVNEKKDYTVLTSGNSPVVKIGKGNENTYAAECSENNLSLFINNKDNPVATVKDPASKFTDGMVGVAVYSPESQGVDVQFAYLAISEPRLRPNLANSGAIATPTPVPSNSLAGQFVDQWDRFGDESQVALPPENGKLHFQLTQKDGQIQPAGFIYNLSSYSDVQMDVVVTNNGNALYGIDLICRLNEKGWYDFEVSSAGSYTIYAYDSTAGNSTTLTSGNSDEIKPGQASNAYTAKCEGNKLSLLVNGKTVQTVQETTFNYVEGSIAFDVFSWDGSPVDMSVDSVTITGAASQPSIPDAGTATVTPGTEAQPTVAPSNDQAFYTEEFDGTLDSWTPFTIGNESQVKRSLESGKLVFSLSAVGDNVPAAYLYNPSFTYTDVQLDVVTTNNGNNSNAVALVCRYTESGWYEFDISNSGTYSIYAVDVVQQSFNKLAEGNSPSIKAGLSTNLYTAVCKGSELTLYVNGDLVDTITDSSFNFSAGNIGIGVSSLQGLPVDVFIESLKVSQP
jgi:hypothetical protein